MLGAAVPAAAQQLSFAGVTDTPVEVTPEAATGLQRIYVVDNLGGATVSYRPVNGGSFSWQKYDSRGGGFATDISGISFSDGTYSITSDGTDTGYVITDGGRTYCFWVVNYSNHQLSLDALNVDTEQSACDRTVLALTGIAEAITYFTINGRPMTLSRELTLSYRTLEFSEDAWTQKEQTETLASASSHISVTAPLCNTDFFLEGDRFLTAWGRAQQVVSPSYTTPAVSAETKAEQEAHDADNESSDSESGDLGGSAPCVITFTAFPTDAVVFREWQFSPTEDFADVHERFNEDVITRTFTDEGTVYARYVCADASGACTYEGPVYPIIIGASQLKIPNAFSPRNQDGINDEWKVSYTSIISFECDIFNRWGQRMAHLTHPSQGWDGRHGGKLVPAGVYFYVIRAKGSDGKTYNKAGDINIIDSRRGTGTANPDGGGGSAE